MPSMPRSDMYDRTEVGTYHCYNNVVQGLDLLGPRRSWIEDRLETLASIFAVDVLTFAVLDTHYHSILTNRPDIAETWDDREVIQRWWRLNAQSLRLEAPPTEDEILTYLALPQVVSEWRLRLGDISWFMKMLDESVSRAANRERERRGHFWADRYQMQVLTDDEALLACVLYVDLNPLRATICDTLEESQYTGIWLRMRDIAAEARRRLGGEVSEESWPTALKEAGWLLPIAHQGDGEVQNGRRCSDRGLFPFSVEEYLLLADRVARVPALGKAGFQALDLPPFFERLLSRLDEWLNAIKNFAEQFGLVVGKTASIEEFSERKNHNFTGRIRRNRNAFDG